MTKSQSNADQGRDTNATFELSPGELDRLRARVHELSEADRLLVELLEALGDELDGAAGSASVALAPGRP